MLLRLAPLVFCLMSCGGGSGGGSVPTPDSFASNTTSSSTSSGATNVATSVCSKSVSNTLTEYWPENTWKTAAPETLGMCPDAIDDALEYAFAAGNDTGAVLIIKNGAIVAERYAEDRDSSSLVTSWSVAKSVTSALVGAALESGDIKGLAEPE